MTRTSFLLPIATLISALSLSTIALAEPVILPPPPGLLPIMECVIDDMILNTQIIALDTKIDTSDLCPADAPAHKVILSDQPAQVYQWDGAQWIWIGEVNPFSPVVLNPSIQSSIIYLETREFFPSEL